MRLLTSFRSGHSIKIVCPYSRVGEVYSKISELLFYASEEQIQELNQELRGSRWLEKETVHG